MSVPSVWKADAKVIPVSLPQEMIKKAFGGILLVDEAYYLYNAANDKDYGQESIEILLNVMEEQKDDLIVTLAGCAICVDPLLILLAFQGTRACCTPWGKLLILKMFALPSCACLAPERKYALCL